MYIQKSYIKQIFVSSVILLSVFAFTATSFEQDRNIWLDNEYKLNLSVNDFEKIVRNEKSFEIYSFSSETDDYIANQYPNKKIDPNRYHLYFNLQKSYCEDNELSVSIFFNVIEDKIIIDSQSVSYWCEQPPNDKDKAEIKLIIERDVIKKIRQNSSQ